MNHYFKSIFKFLSSLKLAVVVLLSLAYVLALGTFYESLYSSAVAKQKVYGTIWFTLILVFLGINVLCAALSRWPWKKHHLGFVITHAGIITILVGALVTQQKGIEGTVALAENEIDNRLVIDEPLLQIVQPDLQAIETFKVNFLKDISTSEKPWMKKLKDKSIVKIDQFYLHATPILEVSDEGKELNPAVQIILSGMPGGQKELSEWLFLKESTLAQNSVQLGPAKLSFIDEKKLQELKSEIPLENESKIGFLQLKLGQDPEIKIRVEEGLKKEIPIEKTAYRLKILRYLPDAVVRENQLISKSNQPNNPAIEFKIVGSDIDETHLVFAKFPDLEGIHGKQKSGLNIKAQFLAGNEVSALSKAELYVAPLSSTSETAEELLYRIRSKGVLGEIKKAKVGEEVATGWMTIRFKIASYVSNAVPTIRYRKVTLPQGKSGGPPAAMHLQIENQNGKTETWIGQGDVKELVIAGVPYLVRYGLRTYPLGFSMQLKEFKIGRYPGTETPSSFESLVEVKNEKKNEKFDSRIYMNNPLHYNGFTLFQSSYQEGENGEMTSVFSVARDPGILIKYGGAILMVSGIALMFWFKPLFMQKKMKRNKVNN